MLWLRIIIATPKKLLVTTLLLALINTFHFIDIIPKLVLTVNTKKNRD